MTKTSNKGRTARPITQADIRQDLKRVLVKLDTFIAQREAENPRPVLIRFKAMRRQIFQMVHRKLK